MYRVSFQKSTSGKNVAKSFTIAAVMATSLLAGCANSSKQHFIVGSTPDDYRTRHPIIVAESEVVEDIPISANMRELSFRDSNVVADIARRFRRSGGRSMQVMVPSQSVNEGAARRISRQIVGTLVQRGVNRSQIVTTSYHAGGYSSSAPVRISFMALAANVGECGKWEENIIADDENRQYRNFGCATQNNLAKMIANPADLVGPRGESSIDATRRDTVITNWRTAGSTPLSTQF